ncbi:phage baseplate plug family protein [Phocoenobacter skyensis]|uniref:Cyanophage baseplate Pam3 plug gp18 domain-containing protein n=1 Tax=Phocoenobacter skyensis TaxID=97481 RepID=A0A1H7XUY7_9PAST|nr:hypothetical protein [Pasteurella skyensis]QLB23312.1 hypothetical protein A6B44_08880 [Pasteurella skyensis]SEM37752.1 hypothetical protein SAMN05444853_11461 [Pasteurella skyensis]
MVTVITVPDLNDSVGEIDINGRTYYLSFSWNSEGEFWVLGVQDSEQETIISGIKMVSNIDLFAKYRYLDIPKVRMIVSMSNGQGKPDRDSFNKREAELIYESEI